MNPETIGQITVLALEIFKEILTDIPKEERQQQWKEFYAWLRSLKPQA